MTDYIEREAALKFKLTANVQREKITVAQAVADAIAAYIKAIPAADVAPVVRCKDCYLHDRCCTEDVFKFARLSDEWRFCGVGSKEHGARMDGAEEADN